MAKIKNTVKTSILNTTRHLQEYIRVTEVILFGSYAAGTPSKYSDIDLAVISPDFEKYDLDLKADLFSNIKLNCNSDVEIHPFTEKALKNARPTNFLGHILKTGTVIYKDGVFLI